MTLVGNATKANMSSSTPPTTKDFYLVSSKLKLSFWSGLAFGFVVGNIAYTVFMKFHFLAFMVKEIGASQYCYCILIKYMFVPDLSCVGERARHYFMFGPFGLLMFLFDFVLWCCQLCCCKRKRRLYTPKLSEDKNGSELQARLDTESSRNNAEINLI